MKHVNTVNPSGTLFVALLHKEMQQMSHQIWANLRPFGV